MANMGNYLIWITATMSVTGIILVSLLFDLIAKTQAKLKLKQHRSVDDGLADLLNYSAVVDDGVIVCKNGSFMAAWTYRGNDNASSTPEERNDVSSRINQALATLGSGWMIHVDAIRRQSSGYPAKEASHFGDYVTEAIDQERRNLFESLSTMYEGQFIITATYLPPIRAERKFVEMMFDDDDETPNDTVGTYNLIAYFKQQCESIESRLSLALKPTRLRSKQITTESGQSLTHDDFLSFIQFCITGIEQPIVLPNNPIYLDALIGGQEMWKGVIPRVGRKYIQIVTIDGLPLESSPGILSALAEIPAEYRWSSRFIFMDSHEAIKHLGNYRKKWNQKVRGFFDQVFNTGSGQINQDAKAMVDDADDALAEINSGLVAFGYFTSLIVLMDEDRQQLDLIARQVEKNIQRLGFGARIETINTLDAFLGSLPGHGVENVRRPLVNTLNLADMIPTSSIWTGEDKAPCPFYPKDAPPLMRCVTDGATPFRLNLHVRDLGHTIIFGPTGAGKSTKLAILAAQFRRYKGMTIYAFDKGQSLFPLTAAIDAATKGRTGRHFVIAADDKSLSFCPLQFLDTPGDISWALEWLDTILVLNGVNTTASQRNEIANALNSMKASNSSTLSDFSTTIQDNAIRDVFKQYTIDGAMGYLLDAEKDGLDLSDFTVFEIEELMNLGEKFALPVLLYLFRRIEKSLNGQPAAIILDEAWLMLAHTVFREKIRAWLKTLRKANAFVLMATQSLSDAANSGILDVIVESCATKIFLPNIYARDEDTSALYRRMGLNSRQIEILANAVPKRDYYYVSENGRRLYDLALGPLALAFVGSSSKEQIASIKKLQQRHGHDWIAHWLNQQPTSLTISKQDTGHV